MATIVNPPPYEPKDKEWPCPAKLRMDNGGPIRKCSLIIQAGRTKHAQMHRFHESEEA